MATTRTVRGALTDEGVACQALRSDAGQLFTLLGDLAGFKTGDRVIVIGNETGPSICLQGTTLGIISIAADAGKRTANAAPRAVVPSGDTPTPFDRGADPGDLGRGTYNCVRLGDAILLSASGTLPNWNDKADLVQLPWRIIPPEFALRFVRGQISLPATRPFLVAELFGFPRTHSTVTVHDADGKHDVPIRQLVPTHPLAALDKAAGGTVRTGYSLLSLQAAFDAAVRQMPPPATTVEGFATYTIRQSGLSVGGFVGLPLYYAQVEATFGR